MYIDIYFIDLWDIYFVFHFLNHNFKLLFFTIIYHCVYVSAFIIIYCKVFFFKLRCYHWRLEHSRRYTKIPSRINANAKISKIAEKNYQFRAAKFIKLTRRSIKLSKSYKSYKITDNVSRSNFYYYNKKLILRRIFLREKIFQYYIRMHCWNLVAHSCVPYNRTLEQDCIILYRVHKLS